MEAARGLKTVVTGATGQLGMAFRAIAGPQAVFLDRPLLDLSNPGEIRSCLADLSPDIVINCAAYTAVDRAEAEPDLAHTVNATAVGEMANVCRSIGASFITFSTDYVFPGTKQAPYLESDEPAPINVYGSTKRDGETAALAADPSALVIRTSWVVSPTHDSFVFKILEEAERGITRVVNDQRGCPTVAVDLALATSSAIAAGVTGILHLTNQTALSRFELARWATELAGMDPSHIEAATSDEFPTPATRPANSVLGSERLPGLTSIVMPTLAESLPDVINGWKRRRSHRLTNNSRK